ncbi:MAG: hypothetical protein OEU36_11585 [Gammaproteobacteria bacterium]|nr:hypothetical protein [Gammaproteobacteria bacterium]
MRRLLSVPIWNGFTLWNMRHERNLPYWPLERLRELQSRRVKEMVAFAYEHVPHYREAIDSLGLTPADVRTAEDLAKLPIVEKNDLLLSPECFMSRGSRTGNALRVESSGTSGSAKSIYQDRRALFVALAHGQRQRQVLGQFVGRNLAYREMTGARPNSVHEQIRKYYEMHSWTPKRIDLNRQILPMIGVSMEEQVTRINRFRPAVIRGYGSYLGALFRHVSERGITIEKPKTIVYGADVMPEVDKELIESEFGIPVLSTYQAVEALRIGFQCEHRRGFHLSIDDVAIRVVDDNEEDVAPGGRGHLLISNLTNRATVLLNYRLGDIVTLGESPCPCGRTLPTIDRIEGRSDDLITLPSGDPMHACVVLQRLQSASGVVQVQLVQETMQRFVIRAVGKTAADRKRAEEELVANLKSTVGRVAVSVAWMDDIPRTAGGKVKAVISDCLPPRQ